MRRGFARRLALLSCGAIVSWAADLGLPEAWAGGAVRSTSEQPSDASASVLVVSNGALCPSREVVETALRQVGLSVATAAAGWVLSYGGASSDSATGETYFAWMNLVSPDDQPVVQRKLPSDDGDCEALAAAMAAVVERSQQELGWTRGEPLPATVRPSLSQPAPVPAPRVPRVILGAGPAVGSSSRVGVNLRVEAQVRVLGPVSLRIGGGVLAGETSEALREGRASVTTRELSATILATFPRGRVHLDTGGVLQLSLDQGRTRDLSQDGEGQRGALAAGLALGGGLRLSPRWRLGFELQGLRAVSEADFTVALDGVRAAVLQPPRWQGIVCTKLEFIAWP